MLYTIANREQKVSIINFLPMKAGGKIGELHPSENFDVYGNFMMCVPFCNRVVTQRCTMLV